MHNNANVCASYSWYLHCTFQVKKIAEKTCIYKNVIIFFGFPGNISFFPFLTPQIYGLIESKSSVDVFFFWINFGSLKGCTLSLGVNLRLRVAFPSHILHCTCNFFKPFIMQANILVSVPSVEYFSTSTTTSIE